MRVTDTAPHNLEAEKCILGAVLIHNEALKHAAALIDTKDFFRDAHRRIFEKMVALSERGSAIDLITVKEELSKSGELEDVGGPAYIASLVDGVPRTANVEYYACIVRQDAVRRALGREANELSRVALSDPAALLNGFPQKHLDRLTRLIARLQTDKAQLRALRLSELDCYQFRRRQTLLTRAGTPIIRAGNLVQISALRGLGKTWLIQTINLVAATGGAALGFAAPRPIRVVQVDGEMAGEEIQERYQQLRATLGVPASENLTIVAADWQDRFLPRLDTAEGQAAIEPFVAPAELVVFDNRSSLFDPEGEKEPGAWQPAQDYLLSLRRRGKAVIVVHHANRQGGARGHSKPEDAMDLLIHLTRPQDWRADQGARFTLTFEKTRGIHGHAAAPFTAHLTSDGWVLEGDQSALSTPEAKLLDYVRLATDAGEPPRSASAAIRGTHLNKATGLKAWAALLEQGRIVAGDQGFEVRGTP
ncbi:MAG TPA: DnaB-like helicase N-terminal domain-containing protein [Vicinamibacterales bacterium]|nr:DnaB-like helicase N-terminal domain-containing protein [Vicinamibacterales bacterium]